MCLAMLLIACSDSSSGTEAPATAASVDAGAPATCPDAVTAFHEGTTVLAGHSTCAADTDCQSVQPLVTCHGGSIEICSFALNAADARTFEERVTTLGNAFCALECGLGVSPTCKTVATGPRCISGICRTQGEY